MYYPKVIVRNFLLMATDSAIGLKKFSSFAGDTSYLPNIAASCNFGGFFFQRGKQTANCITILNL